MSGAERRGAWAWLALTTTATLVVAALVVPWDWLPRGELAPVDPTGGLPADVLRAIADYRDLAVPLGLAATAVSVAVAVLLGLTPRGARLVRRLPARRFWPVQVVLAVLVLVVIGRVAVLPLSVSAELARRDAGLSTLTWPGWALDVGRGVLVQTVATALALLVLMACARWGRRGWWMLASTGVGALVVAGSFVYPVVVEPVFNRFTPMTDEPLRTSLVRLAAADGIEVDEVLVADASRRTTTLNAYVSGFGSTRRIVVTDTLLADAPDDEVRLVVAHELGHADTDDVLTGTVLGATSTMAGVTLLVLLAGTGRVRRWAGVEGLLPRALARPEGVPMVLGLAAVGMLLTLPAQNVVSRALEARADVHSVALTGQAATFEAMQRRLATSNLNDPDPPWLLQTWFGSHPTVAERIALAEGWMAAEVREEAENRSALRGGAAVGERIARFLHRAVGREPQGGHREDDDRGDEDGDQAVLDRRGAGLPAAPGESR